jgi:hypothetical protein
MNKLAKKGPLPVSRPDLDAPGLPGEAPANSADIPPAYLRADGVKRFLEAARLMQDALRDAEQSMAPTRDAR